MERRMARRCGAWTLVAALVAGLAACGGGGSGGSADPGAGPTFSAAPSGPPATAAAVGNAPADAVESARAAVAAADGLWNQFGALSGLAAVFGVPVTGAAAPGVSFSLPRSSAATDKQVLAVTVEPCQSIVDPPCSGSATVDTDIAQTATSVSRGQYFDGSFDAISGFVLGRPVTLTGRMRVEFLTDLRLEATSFAGVQLRLKFTAFGGRAAGAPFGPLSQTMDVGFNAQGAPEIVVDGARYGSLGGLVVASPTSWTIGSGQARVAYGSTAAGYVDVLLSNWQHTGGRAASGFASIAVPGWNVSVQVAGSTATTVVYDVFIAGAVPGTSRQYRVTASYPAGGGAPVYSAS